MTNKERKVIELALEALEDIKDDCSGCEFEWSNDYPLQAKAHTAIKELLAQPEQEPCEYCKRGLKTICLCGIKAKPKEPEQKPVAWVRRHPDGAFTAEFLENAVIEPVRKKSGAWFPLYTTPPQPKEQEPVAFEEWLSKQHGDPEEIGFLQALRIAYISGQDSITTPPQRKPLNDEMRKQMKESCDSDNMEMRGAFIDGWTSAEAAHGIKGEE